MVINYIITYNVLYKLYYNYVIKLLILVIYDFQDS